MLYKLLLVVAVIGAAYLLGRSRARGRGAAPLSVVHSASPLVELTPAVRRWSRPMMAAVAAGVCAVGYAWFTWYAGQRLVEVKVININNGASVNYYAKFGEVGLRSLVTASGQKVTLADVERMEITELR